MRDPLQQTLIDAAEFLDAEQIPYALIGGMAVSLRSQPRMTADVDMVIRADVPRALELITVLARSRFEPLFAGVTDVVQRAFILPLRHRETGVKVDLALGLSGFELQTVERADRLQVAGGAIAVATPEDLLVMKVLAGRPQDDQDVQGLLITHGRCLDWSYCLRVAAELSQALGQDLLTRVSSLRALSGS